MKRRLLLAGLTGCAGPAATQTAGEMALSNTPALARTIRTLLAES